MAYCLQRLFHFSFLIPATSLSILSCVIYCCCRHKCIKRSGEQDSYSGSIVGKILRNVVKISQLLDIAIPTHYHHSESAVKKCIQIYNNVSSQRASLKNYNTNCYFKCTFLTLQSFVLKRFFNQNVESPD